MVVLVFSINSLVLFQGLCREFLLFSSGFLWLFQHVPSIVLGLSTCVPSVCFQAFLVIYRVMSCFLVFSTVCLVVVLLIFYDFPLVVLVFCRVVFQGVSSVVIRFSRGVLLCSRIGLGCFQCVSRAFLWFVQCCFRDLLVFSSAFSSAFLGLFQACSSAVLRLFWGLSGVCSKAFLLCFYGLSRVLGLFQGVSIAFIVSVQCCSQVIRGCFQGFSNVFLVCFWCFFQGVSIVFLCMFYGFSSVCSRAFLMLFPGFAMVLSVFFYGFSSDLLERFQCFFLRLFQGFFYGFSRYVLVFCLWFLYGLSSAFLGVF